jgi:hypothetical protein
MQYIPLYLCLSSHTDLISGVGGTAFRQVEFYYWADAGEMAAFNKSFLR